MPIHKILVPDLGDSESVQVIEVNVAVGDVIEINQTVVALESDKASLDIESEFNGTVLKVCVAEEEEVKSGAVLVELESVVKDSAPVNKSSSSTVQTAAQDSAKKEIQTKGNDSKIVSPSVSSKTVKEQIHKIVLPDSADADDLIEVIEVNAKVGDSVKQGNALLTVETDKASLDIESDFDGVIKAVHVKEGDRIKSGTMLVELKLSQAKAMPPKTSAASTPIVDTAIVDTAIVDTGASSPTAQAAIASPVMTSTSGLVYAGPAVRKLAREFSINLSDIPGSAKNNRIIKEDLQLYVKNLINNKQMAPSALPSLPKVDFARFGTVKHEKRTPIEKIVGANMHRNWVNVPHVSQFDNMDITALEKLRASLKAEAKKRQLKLTPVVFLLRACALALAEHKKINASISNDGSEWIYKNYINLGMAVDTPTGLVVPVLLDVDKKNIWQVAEDMALLAEKAQKRKLKITDMQGGTFTISSLGAIGGAGFTPIINSPELAILGVGKMYTGPVWDGKIFAPHKLLPLVLSYDHRAINGGDAGRFMAELGVLLNKPEHLLGL